MDDVIWDAIQRVADTVPDRVAVQGPGRDAPRYTYRETVRRAKRVGHALAGRGIGLGDRIALWSAVSPSWAVAYLGILHSGGVVVPVDAACRADEAAAIVNAAGCKLLVAAPDLWPRGGLNVALQAFPPMLDLEADAERTEPPSGDATIAGDGLGPLPATVRGDDVATIVFTSGTTGTPRGVVITHASVNRTICGMRERLNLSTDDNVLAIVPSHHVFAPIGNLLIPLAAGATVTYSSAVESTELLRTIRDAGITVFPCVPQVFYRLHRRIFDQVRMRPLPVRWLFSTTLRACGAIRRRTGINAGRVCFASVHAPLGGRLRLLVSGGSYCDPAVISDLDALGFTFQQGYGLTESFGGGTLTAARDHAPGSVGTPIPGMQLRIVNPDQDGVGEIAIAGACVMRGYLDDPEATARAVRNGWLYTGDLGRQDEAGHVYVTGRSTDLIVLSSGKKIVPEVLERYYGQSPAIMELCILGVHEPLDYAGSQRLHAVVVPDFERLKAQGIVNSREAIRSEIERLSRALPPFERVLSYEVRAAPLPRTATKKILRWEVERERTVPAADARFRPSPADRSDADERLCLLAPCRRVLELIHGDTRPRRDPEPWMNLELDLGFDSLQRIELIASVEQATGIRLRPDAASQCVTVRDLLRATIAELEAVGATAVAPQEDPRVRWRDILRGPEVAQVDEPVLRVPAAMSMAQCAALKTIRLAAAALLHFTVRGLENLPPRGPYLICPNHQSYVDGVLIASVLPYSVIRRFVTLGWPAFFSGGVKTVLARMTNCVPIDPDTNLRRAMIVSAAALRQGKVVMIFPEGGLTADGSLQAFKKGPAILAHELQVAIVPVAIKGSFNIWAKGGGRIRLSRVTLTVGRPIDAGAGGVPHEGTGTRVDEIAQRLRAEVGSLLVA
jgi:long-chain acyl-CoA synthetase